MMSVFTALLLVVVLLFWRTFMNIAASNVLLNGIIVGTTIFGIGLCFVNIFRLLPEYKWLHAYFDGRADSGFVPKLLRPIALALRNRHAHITTTSLTELLDLVSIRIEDERDSVRYVTNTLIFLGLLGTFWGLILTVGGFAELLMNLDFDDVSVLNNMQMGMAKPLAGMATAFTSSLLGLAGSLTVGFLGLQLQFAQNTVFQDLTDLMSKYVLQSPDTMSKSLELAENAPVTEATYTKISEIYNAFADNGYEICDLIRIDGKHPAVVAIGTNEKLFIGTTNVDPEILQNTMKRIELCFADTLEGIKIDARILCVSGQRTSTDNIIQFTSTESLHKYMSQHKNVRPQTKQEWETFDAYAEYIRLTIEYLFKPNK
jgi:hypothetical protein